MSKKKRSKRLTIEACILRNDTMSQIASRLGVHKSTISREISHFSITKKGVNIYCNHKNNTNLCNGCNKRSWCRKTQKFYNFSYAETHSSNLRSSSRCKSKLPIDDIKFIDEIVSDGVNLGQSLHHIYVSNPQLKPICSERTIRRLCYRGNLSIRCHQLRRYVTHKHSYKKTPEEIKLRDIKVLVGRSYKDYINYVNHHKRESIVQYDSVIGCIKDKKAILTITFPKYNFQFGILIKKGSADNVRSKIKNLFQQLGKETVKKIFPINLADNGVEFSYFNEIEVFDDGEKVCSTFFTNPYRSTDKSECERNHEFIRYVIPKGKSLDFLTQDKLNEIFSHINSYVRKSKGDSTPYDLMLRKFGKEFLDKIGIKRIPNKKVKLTQII